MSKVLLQYKAYEEVDIYLLDEEIAEDAEYLLTNFINWRWYKVFNDKFEKKVREIEKCFLKHQNSIRPYLSYAKGLKHEGRFFKDANTIIINDVDVSVFKNYIKKNDVYISISKAEVIEEYLYSVNSFDVEKSDVLYAFLVDLKSEIEKFFNYVLDIAIEAKKHHIEIEHKSKQANADRIRNRLKNIRCGFKNNQ